MRHRVKTKIIGRDKEHRKSMLKNLSTQLVTHEGITTTVTKAKYLRPHIEKLITKAKNGGHFNNVKYMKKMLSTDDAVRKILSDLGPRNKTRAGGYTRIIKVGNRSGDYAPMARIEFVEKPTIKKPPKKAKKKAENKETKTEVAKETKVKKKEETKKKATKKKPLIKKANKE